MKKISSTATCYNESDNITELYERCLAVLKKFPEYDYEFIFGDNRSIDDTRAILRSLAEKDHRVKVIFNASNFGYVRSAFNVIKNSTGDAVVLMCADLQEPPEVIEKFIQQWQAGYKVVAGVRSGTRASLLMELGRKLYYKLLQWTASNAEDIVPKFTGFGLYDRVVIDAICKFHEPYPYFRGLVAEVGFSRITVPFVQDSRKRGKSSYNFFRLYDFAMTGVVNHTKMPLRLAVFLGFLISGLCMIAAITYFILKLCFWDAFEMGAAPMLISIFFLFGMQLLFTGIIGEYLGAIWTQVKDKPLVIEEERLNFD